MEENENSTSEAQEPQAPPEPETYTKEQVTQMIKQRIDRVNGKLAEAERRAQEAVDELASMKAKQERDEAARRIAAENGIPEGLLRGSTQEELEAHAAALSPYFKQKNNEGTSSEGYAPTSTVKQSNRDRFADALEGIL